MAISKKETDGTVVIRFHPKGTNYQKIIEKIVNMLAKKNS